MVASGVRSSWEASATNWRTCISLRCRAVSESSTWARRVLSAAPTWPTSVRSSVRCSRHPLGQVDLALGQRERGHGVRGRGDLAERTEPTAYDDQAGAERERDADGGQEELDADERG